MLSFVRVRGAGLFLLRGVRGLTFAARILVRVSGVVVWGWVRHALVDSLYVSILVLTVERLLGKGGREGLYRCCVFVHSSRDSSSHQP